MVLNSYLGATIFVVGSVVLSVIGSLLARRIVHIEKLRPSHDVGGILFSVVGALYSVLVGLIVVDAVQNYQHAREITVQETNSLADVFILAQRLPEPRRSAIRKICSDYASRVVGTEWEQMKCGSYCPLARDLAIDLMQSLVDFEPKTENEKALYPEMISEARDFWQCRQSRISIAERGIPTVEWLTLGAGAVVIVVFSYLFGIESVWIQILMTAMTSLLLSLNLILILLFATPFQGDLAVQAAAFDTVNYIEKRTPTNSTKP
jgi:hypothetical protein